MARRDDHTSSPVSTLAERTTRRFGTGTRYDLLLAVIPLAFALAIGLGAAFDFPIRDGVLGASLIGIAALLDGLFLNPPGSAAG